ncbi:hypothetical protein NCAS_0H00170 [Naumovozyma castellii]|uniref:Uncharacterized protein n=1 Tax=Naumovozyma castellii TaxID=27288 RepID=G0VIK2_NAUCA|nr:hypothetical protein NCAS_0H00170 [Naumovozyma castellii CBS 4309]CCC71327.1 hypothetical protein NCAS_0H00170 [Naumovozyma castellii CBS 4309]
MLQSVQHFFTEFFNRSPKNIDNCGRRKKYYNGLKGMRRKERGRSLKRRSDSVLHRELYPSLSSENKHFKTVSDPKPSRQLKTRRNRIEKTYNNYPKVKTVKDSLLRSLLSRLGTLFSNNEYSMERMQKTCNNISAIVQPNPLKSGEEQEILVRRITASKAFQKKLKDIQYDKQMLTQLKSRVPDKNISYRSQLSSNNITEDKIRLLSIKNRELETELNKTKDLLQLTKKDLKFAKDKNDLLQSLLRDEKTDEKFLQYKAHVLNSSTGNPGRNDGYLASSPSSQENRDNDFGTPNYYNRYPKIPSTEVLKKNHGRHDHHNNSLSPIRIDFTKYSS